MLNILSDRIAESNGAKLDKSGIKINDTMEFNAKNFGTISGYVMQDDILYEHFTVKEALIFAASLKLCHKSRQERLELVEKLIDELGLKKC